MLTDLRVVNASVYSSNSLVADRILKLSFLPKTLTRLSLGLTSTSLPFWIKDTSQIAAQLALLGQSLPSLLTLETSCTSTGDNPLWILPPTLTHFSSLCRIRFSADIALPRDLKVFHAKDDAIDREAMMKTFMALTDLRELFWEFLANWHVFRFPNLESILVHHYTLLSLLDQCPSATALAGEIQFDDDSVVGHPLKFWRSENQHCFPELLPRSLVKMTTMDHRRRLRLRRFGWQQIPQLPPALGYLSLWPHAQNDIPKDAFLSLPSQLVLLDMRHVAFDLRILLPAAPLSLTALRTHGINPVAARLLKRFPAFQELGMYGGRMTATLARSLPRSLRSLTLQHVSLTTKGKYQCKGTGEILKYSSSNPDTTALSASFMPQLTSLYITPCRSHHYWHTHFYEILKDIPTSIRHLALHYRARTPISFWPNEASSDPSSDAPSALPRTFPSDLFSRLESLVHLYLYAGALALSDYGWFVGSLPRNIVALSAGSVITAPELPHLPRSVQYFTLYKPDTRGLLDYKEYEDSHDPWRGPKEKDYFSAFQPSASYPPYSF